MRTPTKKKNYNLNEDDAVVTVDQKNIKGLQEIYNSFFSTRNCTHLMQILNRYSRIDAVLTSGDTQILVEYKDRTSKSVSDFDSVLLEREKYTKLVEAGKLLDAPALFYIHEFSDAVLIYQLHTNEQLYYTWEQKELPSQLHNGKLVNKTVTFLHYDSAAYIIGKRKWQQATTGQLHKYITIKRGC